MRAAGRAPEVARCWEVSPAPGMRGVVAGDWAHMGAAAVLSEPRRPRAPRPASSRVPSARDAAGRGKEMVVAKNPGERGKWALSLLGPEAAVVSDENIDLRKADTRRRYRVRGDVLSLSELLAFPSQIPPCTASTKAVVIHCYTLLLYTRGQKTE